MGFQIRTSALLPNGGIIRDIINRVSIEIDQPVTLALILIKVALKCFRAELVLSDPCPAIVLLPNGREKRDAIDTIAADMYQPVAFVEMLCE